MAATSSNWADASIVWDGRAYGIAYQSNTPGNYKVYFTRVAADGTAVVAPQRITSAASTSQDVSLVWTGGEYGVAWQDYRDAQAPAEIYFARIDASGSKIGSDVRVSSLDNFDGIEPSLARSGSEFGVAWADARAIEYEIWFSRVSSTGGVLMEAAITPDDAINRRGLSPETLSGAARRRGRATRTRQP